MDQANTNNFDKASNNPEQEKELSKSLTHKIGGFALRVAEVVTYTGVAWASQELIFHDSLPLAVNVAIAGGAAASAHMLRNKK